MTARDLTLANEHVELDVTISEGPRVLDFRLAGETTPFARVPGLTLLHPDGAEFRLIGGHRLWCAPEDPAVTYRPDDKPVAIEELSNGIRATQPAHPDVGLGRAIDIRLDPDRPVVHLIHRITNLMQAQVAVAPWAITMLRGGGHAVLPLGDPTSNAYQAQRNVVLWPYTRLADPLIDITDDQIIVDTRRADPTKIGTSGGRGWLAYVIDDIVFVKTTGHMRGPAYADLSATAQVYANDVFCELESLGPLTTLEPGESVTHPERWQILDAAGRRPDEVAELIEGLNI